MKNAVLLFICILLIVKPAFSQEMDNTPEYADKSWYVLGGYSTSIWSSDDWSDTKNGGEQVTSHQNQKLKSLNSYIIGLGHQFDSWGFELTYEDLTRIRWTVGRTTQRNGTVAQTGQADFETKNLMLNISKDLWGVGNGKIYGILGVGKGEHYNDTAYLTVLGTKVEYAKPLTTDVTTYRAGLGYRKNISSKIVFDSRVAFTDYGKAHVWDNVSNSDEYIVTIQSIDAGAYLRYLF